MTRSFADQVAAFAAKAKGQLDEVVAGSARDVLATAQRKAPVDTGELVDSLHVAINGAPVAHGEEAALAATRAKAGDVIRGEWTADHARPVEYGAAGRTPVPFVRGAVDQWPEIVRRNVRKATKP